MSEPTEPATLPERMNTPSTHPHIEEKAIRLNDITDETAEVAVT